MFGRGIVLIVVENGKHQGSTAVSIDNHTIAGDDAGFELSIFRNAFLCLLVCDLEGVKKELGDLLCIRHPFRVKGAVLPIAGLDPTGNTAILDIENQQINRDFILDKCPDCAPITEPLALAIVAEQITFGYLSNLLFSFFGLHVSQML